MVQQGIEGNAFFGPTSPADEMTCIGLVRRGRGVGEFFASLKNAKLDTPQQRSAFSTKMQEEMSSWGTQLGAFCGP
jgi:hypothetical protein